MPYVEDYRQDEPDRDTWSDEDVERIWKRVLAASGDLSAAFEPLMRESDGAEAPAEGRDPGPPPAENGPQGEYNIYADINESIYGNAGNIAYIASEYSEQTPDSTAAEPPRVESAPEAERLVRALIDEGLSLSRICRALARSAPGKRASRVLTLISNRDHSAAKSLSSAYFLHTGNYYFPRDERHPAEIPADSTATDSAAADAAASYRTALRDTWRTEAGLTSRCADAAEKAVQNPLSKALIGAAGAHAENAAALRRLIEQSLD